jgi:hypothetical protein
MQEGPIADWVFWQSIGLMMVYSTKAFAIITVSAEP